MKRIGGYLKPYIAAIALGLSCKFIGTIAELFLPWILSHMIDVVAPTDEITLLVLHRRHAHNGLEIAIKGDRSLDKAKKFGDRGNALSI